MRDTKKTTQKDQPQQPHGAKIKELFSSEQTMAHFKSIVGPRYQAFIAAVMQIVDASKDLAIADPQSLFKAAEMAAILDLPLNNNLQFAHISAYPDEKPGVIYAQFHVGWRGLVQLGLRSLQFKTINVGDVRQGELVNRDRLSGECEFKWEQDDEKREALPIVGYLSYFRLLSGFEKSIYRTVKELDEHGKKYSKTYDKKNSFWITDRPAMYRKNVIKELFNNYAPMTVETMLPIAKAIQADQSVMVGDGFEYPDNPTNSGGEAAKANTKDRANKAANAAEDFLKKKTVK